jgi:pimeloyl-ACP methyl ester carboxylesterase
VTKTRAGAHPRAMCRTILAMPRHALWLLSMLAVVSLAPCPGLASVPAWRSLPQPSSLPTPDAQGILEVDDVKLWFASFGKGTPVLLLHGGLGNSEHFGDLVRALAKRHRVLVLDSRGHGRSTRSHHGISYAQMADDVIALLEHEKLDRVAIVGWSDGGVIGLDLAIRYPERVSKLFVIGTNYDLTGVKSAGKSKMFAEYFTRCKREYARQAPDPGQLPALLKELRAMWTSQPTFTSEQLGKIAAPTVIALGEYDEIIRREHAVRMAKLIPHATLQLLPRVSHFALWQDHELVTRRVTAMLD